MNNSAITHIKKCLDILGWTQKDLASQLGLSEVTMSLWLTGKRTPDRESAFILLTFFRRLTLEDIYGFEK